MHVVSTHSHTATHIRSHSPRPRTSRHTLGLTSKGDVCESRRRKGSANTHTNARARAHTHTNKAARERTMPAPRKTELLLAAPADAPAHARTRTRTRACAHRGGRLAPGASSTHPARQSRACGHAPALAEGGAAPQDHEKIRTRETRGVSSGHAPALAEGGVAPLPRHLRRRRHKLGRRHVHLWEGEGGCWRVYPASQLTRIFAGVYSLHRN